MQRGFSLVELSIVLVILGLLTGGILAGQSLIRAAELRSISTDYQRYVAAINTFRDKYFAVPGDFKDATRFWQRQTTGADCVTNSSATGPVASGACDGNGNGQIDFAAAVSQSGESFQFWRHLATAGLLEGTYTGVAGPGATQDAIIGTNVPRSRMPNMGWSVRPLGHYGGDGSNFAAHYGNSVDFGTKLGTTGSTIGGGIKAEEAWNIDVKMDDGKPGTGKAIVYNRNVCSNSTSATDTASDYALSYTGTECGFYFANFF